MPPGRGHPAHRLGVTLVQLRHLDTELGTAGGGVLFGRSRHPLTKRIEPQARVLADYLQHYQDGPRGTWRRVADQALQRGDYIPRLAEQEPYRYDRRAGM